MFKIYGAMGLIICLGHQSIWANVLTRLLKYIEILDATNARLDLKDDSGNVIIPVFANWSC
jgi:hypothetical protein